jgi:cytochrome bd ubiquinol oxidase subunit II
MELQSVWFFLWGLLWAMFFVTDGFDFGVGILLPFLGREEKDRRMMINAIGPLWDGNEVWLITAGGVTFAAFPALYATMFSALYTPLLLILFALIFRGVSFEFRSQIASPAWKGLWDTCIFLGSLVPAFLFGVVFANIFQGLPFDAKGYSGGLLALFNPYGTLGGVLFLFMFLLHGSLWLSIRATGDLQRRAVSSAHVLWYALVAMMLLFLVASGFYTQLYDNYLFSPILFAVPALTVLALVGIRRFLGRGAYFKAWFSSAATILTATFFCMIGLYPDMLPSSTDAQFSLTAHNASASPLTLTIMLIVVLIFIPLVIGYQAWAYRLFSDKLSADDAEYDASY